MIASPDPLCAFHPTIRLWFQRRFTAPTEAQARGWPSIMRGRDTLISAPTGSGKTLAAFLAGIDRLLRKAEARELTDAVDVLYVSPLKALSNDIQRNLDTPLAEIQAISREMGLPDAGIRTMVRTSDTSPADRRAMLRRPPHILITTPESLYLMLTAASAREMLRQVSTVIVDEIHALVRDKRGSHLSLSLARLEHLCRQRPARIGLSATQRPIEKVARFLTGATGPAETGAPGCAIVDLGHQRDLDLAIEVPPTDLQAVCSGEQWNDIYDRLAELVRQHRTTLIFVNTRRLAERAAHHLRERLGEDLVAAHHGSLAKDRRLRLEERLKMGQMKALVATASLELGIDIGSIDLVCQLESPRSMSAFLQRVGRSGHALGLVPKGRLFPTTRDELVESAALVRAVKRGCLDAVLPPPAPLDILAQQIVAECACQSWAEDGLFDLVREAAPYHDLTREQFDQVVAMLCEGYGSGGGRSSGYLHHDRIQRQLRGRRGARQAAIENGGAIPETADYRVVTHPEGAVIGTVNEDFAVESLAGDIFLLGSQAWRILKVESDTVRVEDAQGLPPSIPFWLGEAPSRTSELSQEVSALRLEMVESLERGEDARALILEDCKLDAYAARQLTDYIREGSAALGILPTGTDIVFERFFDESGGMQLVIHAPLGARLNRAFGLALRKRFCRTFNFELQAAASDDAILISLGAQHSFPLEDVFHFLSASSIEGVITQAILASPMFTARWRWNATRSLAVARRRNGQRVPPFIQRMRSDDLLAAVFPQQVACQENLAGPIDLPDHPLVNQTVFDCLHEALDIDGLKDMLLRIESGRVRLHAKETTEPSLFAHEILNGRPYTYLDDAPLEERRARAVQMRRTLPESARDLGTLDPAAIDRVRQEAWPQPRDADELHEALSDLIVLGSTCVPAWQGWYDELSQSSRSAAICTNEGELLWFVTENMRFIEKLYPHARIIPSLQALPALDLPDAEREEALLALVRGQVSCLGPITATDLEQRANLPADELQGALIRLEGSGELLRGRFTENATDDEFCDRRLLARIHRYTIDRLRHEIAPVSAQDYLRFLLRWQHIAPGARLEGKIGLLAAIEKLQGFEAPVATWERHILPARVTAYRPSWLDELCLSGEVVWARLSLGRSSSRPEAGAAASAITPVSLARRRDLPWLLDGIRNGAASQCPEAGAAHDVREALAARGALFLEEITTVTRRLSGDVERGLWELVARGQVTADGFQALRSLMGSGRRQAQRRLRSLGRRSSALDGPAGRWALLLAPYGDERPEKDETADAWAVQLLRRYGVVFRSLIEREALALPWREIARALRRLEARGIARGGRFVEGFFGEQYALPEAVESLRRIRRQDAKEETAWINATDPLNLMGILTAGPRLPAILSKALFYRNGLLQPEGLEGAGRALA